MNRLVKIRQTFTHRRSKSDDSQMFNNWSTACLQPDDEEEIEDFPAIMAATATSDDPFSGEPGELVVSADNTEPSNSKSGSTSSLPFLSNLTSSFRKKLASDTNQLFSSTPDDNAKLHHSNDDPNVFSYDNDGLRKSSVLEAGAASVPAAPKEAVAWVTFDDNFPPAEGGSAEFVEIPLDGGDTVREDGSGNRLMQNLKKIPLRFRRNQRYKSLEPDAEEEEEAPNDDIWSLPVQRSNSLPTSPSSVRKKLASAFSNLKRQ